MNNMISKLTVVLAMQLPFKIMSTIFSHLNLFKDHNVMFNLNNMTTTYRATSFFGYLLI